MVLEIFNLLKSIAAALLISALTIESSANLDEVIDESTNLSVLIEASEIESDEIPTKPDPSPTKLVAVIVPLKLDVTTVEFIEKTVPERESPVPAVYVVFVSSVLSPTIQALSDASHSNI